MYLRVFVFGSLFSDLCIRVFRLRFRKSSFTLLKTFTPPLTSADRLIHDTRLYFNPSLSLTLILSFINAASVLRESVCIGYIKKLLNEEKPMILELVLFSKIDQGEYIQSCDSLFKKNFTASIM